MKTSEKGLSLIKKFEGLRLIAYKCPAGVWTIGYGHTGTVDSIPIQAEMAITKEKAEALLKADLLKFENAINKNVKVPLTQNKFDALICFVLNVGIGAFENSTLLKLLNQSKYTEVPAQLMRWNKAGKTVIAGLTKRRYAESLLWATGNIAGA